LKSEIYLLNKDLHYYKIVKDDNSTLIPKLLVLIMHAYASAINYMCYICVITQII